MFNIKKTTIATIMTSAILGTTVFASTGTVNTDGLRLRKEASTDGEVVTILNTGAQVEILEKTGDWYSVKYYDEYQGYAYGEYVSINGETPEHSAPVIAETPETPQEPEVVETPEQEPEANNSVIEKVLETPKTIYPIESTIKNNAKVYMLPLITATPINELVVDTKITIKKELNNWVFISSGEISGWVRKYSVNISEIVAPAETETTEKPEETTEQKPVVNEQEPKITKGYVSVDAARIRAQASTTSDILEVLILNTQVTITAETEEWYKIQFDQITGYISKSLISETVTQTSRSSTARQTNTELQQEANLENKTEVKAESENTENVQSQEKTDETNVGGKKVVDYAKQYLGKAYTYGGTTPTTGFDCSGFVYYVYNSCGYSLSRSGPAQAKSGRSILKENLQEGDLVFFNNTSDGTIGHVGIYIGNGNFIHASTPSKGVRIDTIQSGYYNTYYYSARRIILE